MYSQKLQLIQMISEKELRPHPRESAGAEGEVQVIPAARTHHVQRLTSQQQVWDHF